LAGKGVGGGISPLATLQELLAPAVQHKLVLQAHGSTKGAVQQPGRQMQVALPPTRHS
jgi:hypothetical protein